MFLKEVAGALRRLWYLVVVGALLSGWAAYAMWNQTEPTYSSEASVLLLPPANVINEAAPDGSDTNPLMNLSGLAQARDVLISVMSSASEKELVIAEHPGASYNVDIDPLSSGPILIITTESERASEASRSLEFLLEELARNFEGVQVELGVAADSTIGFVQLTAPTTPELDSQPQLRAAATAAGGVLVVTLLLVAVIDGLIRYVRRKKESAAVGADGGPEAADDPVEEVIYEMDDFDVLSTNDDAQIR